MTIRKPADLKVGEVFRYPYLWRREGQRGETEGRKDRPARMIMRWTVGGEELLIFLPITGTRPTRDQPAIEIPAIELQRAGLDATRQGWIILSEGNLDRLSGSFYFDRSQTPLGRFGRAFMVSVLKAVHPFLKNRNAFMDRR
jgi:hypothetical protein